MIKFRKQKWLSKCVIFLILFQMVLGDYANVFAAPISGLQAYRYEKFAANPYSLQLVGSYDVDSTMDPNVCYKGYSLSGAGVTLTTPIDSTEFWTFVKTGVVYYKYQNTNVYNAYVTENGVKDMTGNKFVLSTNGTHIVRKKRAGDWDDVTYYYISVYKVAQTGTKLGDVIALNGTYPDDGVKDGYYYIKKEAATYCPQLTIDQANGSKYIKNETLNITGTFRDTDTDAVIGTKYELKAADGRSVATGLAADMVPNGSIIHNINFNLPLQALANGTYTLNLWAENSVGYKSDVKSVQIEKVSGNAIRTENLKIDTTTIELDLTADNGPYALKAQPYRVIVKENDYTVYGSGLCAPNKGQSLNVKVGNLKPNTPYSIQTEATNTVDVSSFNSQMKYTLALTPVVTASQDYQKNMSIKASDNNPPATQYNIKLFDNSGNSFEVRGNGDVVPADGSNWITLGANKLISIPSKNLKANASYKLLVTARNGDNVPTQSISVVVDSEQTESVDAPNEVGKIETLCKATEISANWAAVKDATYYKVKLLAGTQVISETQVLKPQILLTGLSPETVYTLEVKAGNSTGESDATKQVAKTKIAEQPAPTFLTSATVIENYSVTVAWNPIPKAISYQVEADGELYNLAKETSFKHLNLPPNSRHVYRIRTENATGFSAWSAPYVVNTTRSVPLNTVTNSKVYASDDTVIVSWDAVTNAKSYEISFNGGPRINNGANKFCIRNGLKPDSQYDYTIYAVNDFGSSDVVGSGSIKTKYLKTPQIMKIDETPSGYLLNWQSIPGASYYQVMVNGTVLPDHLTATKYEITGLGAKEVKNYSIAAFCSAGTSAWSKEVTVEGIAKVPQKPVNFNATATESRVVLTWSKAEEDADLLYEVEVDGVVVESLESDRYLDVKLEPYTNHTYRVRAKNAYAFGEWTDPISVKTIPGQPKAPNNIRIDNSTYFANMSWDAVDSATGYDVAIKNADGTFKVIQLGTQNFYRQRNLLNVEQAYKVRANNLIGDGEWSKLIVNNAIKAKCEKGQELDLGLTAAQIVDFSKYELQVSYNPGAVEVTDLCAYTSEKELTVGKIKGTDIEVVSFEPGKIVIKVSKGVEQGMMWTGVVNNIKFKSKLNGGSFISYTVFVDETKKNDSDTSKIEQ